MNCSFKVKILIVSQSQTEMPKLSVSHVLQNKINILIFVSEAGEMFHRQQSCLFSSASFVGTEEEWISTSS